jgi:hypothetical protein
LFAALSLAWARAASPADRQATMTAAVITVAVTVAVIEILGMRMKLLSPDRGTRLREPNGKDE